MEINETSSSINETNNKIDINEVNKFIDEFANLLNKDDISSKDTTDIDEVDKFINKSVRELNLLEVGIINDKNKETMKNLQEQINLSKVYKFIKKSTVILNSLNENDTNDEQKKNIKNLQKTINSLKSSEETKLMNKLYSNVTENKAINIYFDKFSKGDFNKLYNCDEFYEYFEEIEGILQKFNNKEKSESIKDIIQKSNNKNKYKIISNDMIYLSGFLGLGTSYSSKKINLIKTLFENFQLEEEYNKTINFLEKMSITEDNIFNITAKNFEQKYDECHQLENNLNYIYPKKVMLEINDNKDYKYYDFYYFKEKKIIKIDDIINEFNKNKKVKIKIYFVYQKEDIDYFIKSMEGVMAVFRNIILLKFCDKDKMREEHSKQIYYEYSKNYITTIQDYIKFLSHVGLKKISNNQVLNIFKEYKDTKYIETKIDDTKINSFQNPKTDNSEIKTEINGFQNPKTNDSEIKTEIYNLETGKTKIKIDNSNGPGTIIFAISLVIITGVIIYFSIKNNSNNNDKNKKDNDNY